MLRIKSIQFDKDFDFGFTYEQLEPGAVVPEVVTVKKSNMPPGKEIMQQIALIVPQVALAAGVKTPDLRNNAALEKMAFGRDDAGDYVEIVINRPIDNFTSHSQMKLPRAYYRPEGAEEQLDMFPSQLDRDIKELQRMLQDSILRYLVTSLLIEDETIYSTGNTQGILSEIIIAKHGEGPKPNRDAKIIRMTTPSTIPDVSF